jgi:hypothetical protein
MTGALPQPVEFLKISISTGALGRAAAKDDHKTPLSRTRHIPVAPDSNRPHPYRPHSGAPGMELDNESKGGECHAQWFAESGGFLQAA